MDIKHLHIGISFPYMMFTIILHTVVKCDNPCPGEGQCGYRRLQQVPVEDQLEINTTAVCTEVIPLTGIKILPHYHDMQIA